MSNPAILNYCLIVTGPAYGTQQASSAYQFAQALLAEGHQLKTIFFYQDGVYNANRLTSPASDEFNLVAAWQQFSALAGCELHICVAAALRRGIINHEQAAELGESAYNLADKFIMSGLGTLAEAMLTCDRVIRF
ncbi:TusD family tRNA 5-methylaminomethyl-2-thiouridine synthase [Moellerella wisconsensis ATCC 35017]|uniref:Sulfurtransferase TusD n=1 Tax=Moellerella wisconsensis ATCC 35017 TaxID=1354267 RepID=A0A0N0IBT4_9GAMM|nr:TusD family tRNA 5-methylaminomethyl-2-thiouridine synthase [Moellerella wisconsensis ATCC 35017]VFS50354.1 Sulfurtransferase TusD [Moellerella wisconsensis]